MSAPSAACVPGGPRGECQPGGAGRRDCGLDRLLEDVLDPNRNVGQACLLTRGQDLFLDVRGGDKRVGADICVARKNGEQV
jgi:hypothetical protein